MGIAFPCYHTADDGEPVLSISLCVYAKEKRIGKDSEPGRQVQELVCP